MPASDFQRWERREPSARKARAPPAAPLEIEPTFVISNDLTKEKDMNDKEAKPQEASEEVLMRELRFGGIDKENLKELVGIVAKIQRGGLKKFKVFPLGIPVPDGVRLSGMIDAGEANKFLGELLMKTPRLGGVVVFPYGIPWPEIFRVNIDVGGPAEMGPPNRF